ncbi:recombinase family protein [Elizabethkingia meningoseptica]|uniref:recombinase family protein n=1 Tax=Elizabethkingia meningoseptica TaxID=238 RepID=UPI0038920840
MLSKRKFSLFFSARDFNRPGWQQYISHINTKSKEPRYLLVTTWDRFSRNTEEALKTIDQLKKLM